MLTDHIWLIVIIALLILAACAFMEWLHDRRDKRGRLANVQHMARYHADGWRHL